MTTYVIRPYRTTCRPWLEKFLAAGIACIGRTVDRRPKCQTARAGFRRQDGRPSNAAEEAAGSEAVPAAAAGMRLEQ